MTDQFHLYFETEGNPTDPAVILISGLSGQLTYWPSPFIKGLVAEGFYVICFDNRDVGLSRSYDHLPTPDMRELVQAAQQGKPVTPPYHLDDMASDVIALLDRLKIAKVHLVGTSMGGMIAQLVALDYPERALSLTCIGSSSGDPMLPPASPEVVKFISATDRKSESMEDYLDTKLRLHKIYNPHEVIDEEKMRMIYRKTYERAHNPAGFLRQMIAMIFAPSRAEKLQRLSLPTLIIHGSADPVFTRHHGEQLAEKIPNAQLQMIENLGHSFPHEKMELVIQWIANLKKQSDNSGAVR